MKTLSISEVSAAIPNASTAVIGSPIVLRGTIETMFLEIISDDEDLDVFEVQFLAHPDATWTTVQSTYAATSIILEYYNTDIAALTAAAVGLIRLNTRAVYSIRLRASVAANTSNVTVKGIGYSTGEE